MKSSTFHSWLHKNWKQTNGLILKVYFGIVKTQNVIIIFKLSLLKGIMWEWYKILCEIHSSVIWESLGCNFQRE